ENEIASRPPHRARIRQNPEDRLAPWPAYVEHAIGRNAHRAGTPYCATGPVQRATDGTDADEVRTGQLRVGGNNRPVECDRTTCQEVRPGSCEDRAGVERASLSKTDPARLHVYGAGVVKNGADDGRSGASRLAEETRVVDERRWAKIAGDLLVI